MRGVPATRTLSPCATRRRLSVHTRPRPSCNHSLRHTSIDAGNILANRFAEALNVPIYKENDSDEEREEYEIARILSKYWYDDGTSRFLNRDPIDYAGGANLYAFCDGNPVNESDPDGTDPLYQNYDDDTDVHLNGDGSSSVYNSYNSAVSSGCNLTLQTANTVYSSLPYTSVAVGIAGVDALGNTVSTPDRLCDILAGGLGEKLAAGAVVLGGKLICDVIDAAKAARGLPEVIFDYNKTPELADNIWNAIRAGHDRELTYAGPLSGGQNRNIATAGIQSPRD